MFPPKFLLVVAIPVCLSLSYFHFEAYGDASGDVSTSPTPCLNCAKCDPPCQQQSPPSTATYPSYGVPPPPSPTPSGYSIYGAPPPPPHDRGHSKCPPAGGGVQCCTPPPPYYSTYYGPPNPYTYAPPYPYTYVPYNQGFASALLPIQVLLMMLFSYFIFLF